MFPVQQSTVPIGYLQVIRLFVGKICLEKNHIYETDDSNQLFLVFNFRDPCHPRCHGLILLETFTTELSSADVINRLPPFLKAYKDVTGDPAFSMYNLALK